MKIYLPEKDKFLLKKNDINFRILEVIPVILTIYLGLIVKH